MASRLCVPDCDGSGCEQCQPAAGAKERGRSKSPLAQSPSIARPGKAQRMSIATPGIGSAGSSNLADAPPVALFTSDDTGNGGTAGRPEVTMESLAALFDVRFASVTNSIQSFENKLSG